MQALLVTSGMIAALCARPAAAELVNENLLVAAPPGYKGRLS